MELAENSRRQTVEFPMGMSQCAVLKERRSTKTKWSRSDLVTLQQGEQQETLRSTFNSQKLACTLTGKLGEGEIKGGILQSKSYY